MSDDAELYITDENYHTHKWEKTVSLSGEDITGFVCSYCRVLSDEKEAKEPCPGKNTTLNDYVQVSPTLKWYDDSIHWFNLGPKLKCDHCENVIDYPQLYVVKQKGKGKYNHQFYEFYKCPHCKYMIVVLSKCIEGYTTGEWVE